MYRQIFTTDPYDSTPHADVHQIHQRHLLAGDGSREFTEAFFRLLDGAPTAGSPEWHARAGAAYAQLQSERPTQAAAVAIWSHQGNLSAAARAEGLTPQAVAKRKAQGLAFLKARMRDPDDAGSPV